MCKTIRTKEEKKEDKEMLILKIIATIGHCLIGLMLLGFPLADPNFQPKFYQNILVVSFWICILIAIWR